MKPPRKLHIKSYGCQMNVYDAQRMVDTLAPEGFVETASVEDADLVILNTCHIREKASEKVYSELGRLRAAKDEAARDGRGMSIVVAGCVAQAEGEEIIRRAPVVDVVVGPQSYHHLPQLLLAAQRPKAARWRPNFRSRTNSAFCPRRSRQAIRARGISAFVTVQEGCDKFCTFCVVPYTRGAEVVTSGGEDHRGRGAARRQRRARDHPDRAERQRLSWRRSRRATLAARQAAASSRRNSQASCGCATRPAIRATSTILLIDAHRDLAALMPFVHLPVQSGSDRILAAMNRRAYRR